jgi:ADP-heptose:LPS heptosyltransferase
VDRYFSTAKKLGIEKDGKGLDFYIPEQKEVDVHASFGFARGAYIAIVIGAAHQTKCLTTDQIARLCDLIKYPVVLMGGPGERQKASEIINKSSSKQVKNACADFDILQSGSILKQSAAVISHDTGLMHIAAALNKPQVVIWGNTIPQFGMYPYYGSEKTEWKSFEQTNLTCRPCSKIGFATCPKGHFKCIRNHSMEDIAGAALTLSAL